MRKPISIKFLFANKDGIVLEQDSDMTMLVSEVKARLLAAWPKGNVMCLNFQLTHPCRAEAGDVYPKDHIRLICMGKGILADNKTLEGASKRDLINSARRVCSLQSSHIYTSPYSNQYFSQGIMQRIL